MRDTLENLYFGNITPNDQIVKSGTALKKAMEQSAECEEKLTALLEDKEKALLLRLINAENEIGSTMALENFILGFRLGVRMILEALDEDDGSLLDPNKEGYPMAKRRPSGDGMVRKREDGRWEGRIVVGHKQNGEPIFRYVLAKTQKELLDKLHRDLEAFQDVELTEDSRMTLGEWLDRWMEDYGAATLRPNTLRSYEQFIRCYIKPYLGNKIVSRVTRMDIQKLYRKLKHEGRVREHPEHGHELSDTMVLRIHAMLHRCLKDAEAAHVIARNPTDGAVVPKANHRPKQILTKEQMDTFLAAVDRSEIWRDFFYTELTTGLRRGEICGLMWQDFDEKAGTLKVLRSVNVPKAGELEIGETKTSQGRRTIRLPPSTVQRLRERKKHAISQWIFPEPLAPEKPVRPSAAYYWMKRILREAGLPAIRFHDLRHPYVKHTTKNIILKSRKPKLSENRPDNLGFLLL